MKLRRILIVTAVTIMAAFTAITVYADGPIYGELSDTDYSTYELQELTVEAKLPDNYPGDAVRVCVGSEDYGEEFTVTLVQEKNFKETVKLPVGRYRFMTAMIAEDNAGRYPFTADKDEFELNGTPQQLVVTLDEENISPTPEDVAEAPTQQKEDLGQVSVVCRSLQAPKGGLRVTLYDYKGAGYKFDLTEENAFTATSMIPQGTYSVVGPNALKKEDASIPMKAMNDTVNVTSEPSFVEIYLVENTDSENVDIPELSELGELNTTEPAKTSIWTILKYVILGIAVIIVIVAFVLKKMGIFVPEPESEEEAEENEGEAQEDKKEDLKR